MPIDYTTYEHSPSRYGLNFTLGQPIFDPKTASHNLGVYLEWAEQEGFKREARIVCDTYWGQRFTERYWLPVFAARGWKVSCIVGTHPGGWSKEEYIAAHVAWTQHLVDVWGPRGRDILIQVEPINEPWHPNVKMKKSWLKPYHVAIKQVANAAGVPTAAGYGWYKGINKDTWAYYEKSGFNWETDVDLISINSEKKTLKLDYLRKRISNLDARLVMTEGQFHHDGRVPDSTRIFLYTCIGENTGKPYLNVCPETLPEVRYERGILPLERRR